MSSKYWLQGALALPCLLARLRLPHAHGYSFLTSQRALFTCEPAGAVGRYGQRPQRPGADDGAATVALLA